jgi:hypothetical protein
MPNQPGNASILFAKGGIESATEFSSTDQTFQLSLANKALFTSTVADNPCKVMMVVTPSTGLFTGSLTITDTGISRTIKYAGILLSHHAKGTGYFLLPGLTPNTASSSILSGKVTLN